MLWVAEGFTSYYESILLLRAGMIDRKEFLKLTAKRIADHRNAPGRRVQSAAESSFDTWIKYYRADENFGNSQVSYYVKGALVALMLDLEIRRRTGGDRSLDDLMRGLHAESRAAGFRGYEFRDVRRIAESLAGGSLAGFFRRYAYGRDEVDFPRILSAAGLACDLRPPDASDPWLGATTKRDPATGMPAVDKIHAEGPAAEAGLCVNDLVVALDGLRVAEETVKARLGDRKPGDTVRIALFRDDRLREVDVTLGARPTVTCAIEEAGKSGRRAELREAWLAVSPDAERPKAKVRERARANERAGGRTAHAGTPAGRRGRTIWAVKRAT
jgi:predicted metalloprotease with PDZ domain